MTDSSVRCPHPVQNAIRHAVALNNIGVTLLERQCYGQALQTLQDAMIFIHQIIHAVEATCCEESFRCALLHQNAFQRLSHPCPVQPQQMMMLLEMVGVELFSDDKVIDSIMYGVSTTQEAKNEDDDEHKRFNGTLHPIRLDGEHYNMVKLDMNQNALSEGMKDESLEFEVSIILHNLGLAHLGMSIVSPCSSIKEEVTKKAMQYRNRAYQCLRKAFIISTKTISDRTTTTPNTKLLNILDMSWQYRAAAIQTHSMLQVFDNSCTSELDRDPYKDERNQYTIVFEHIVQNLNSTKVWIDELGLISAATGAA
jgi:hypothetical protein